MVAVLGPNEALLYHIHTLILLIKKNMFAGEWDYQRAFEYGLEVFPRLLRDA
jgi:hypothetical protein